MSQTIQVSEKTAASLAPQAAAQGLSVEALIDRMVEGKGLTAGSTRQNTTCAAAEGILDVRTRVKPDPEGWTSRDYVVHGRR